MDANAATRSLAEQQDAFLKFVRRQVGDLDLALDVLQESFLKALAKAEDLRDEAQLIPWFYRILRSTAVDAQRGRMRRERLARDLATETPTAVESLDPLERRSAEAVSACLSSLLPQMTPAYAELIRELDLHSQDAGAFAKGHGLSAGALKVKHHRARRQLQHLIVTTCRCPIDVDADCVCGCDTAAGA